MLQITIPSVEIWDEAKQEFAYFKEQKLNLEHSLVSVSKWEAKWGKPFINRQEKSLEETIDYVRCMTITQNVPPEIYKNLTDENIRQVNEYIEAPMTASWFSEEPGSKAPSRKQVTSELIYYWMTVFNIPMECQKWHLSRLITLIRVCEAENRPRKKKSNKELYSRNRALNEARKKRAHSKG